VKEIEITLRDRHTALQHLLNQIFGILETSADDIEQAARQMLPTCCDAVRTGSENERF
jgi:hypothetical protein